MKKIIIMLVIVAGLMFMPYEKVSAFHTSPYTGNPCNNTGYTYSDYMAPVSHWMTTHWMDGGVCTVNTFVYNHKMYCSSCTQYLGFGATYECTETHTNQFCKGRKDCAGLNPTPTP